MLPRHLEPRSHDVVAVGELAHQLLVRCEPDDPVVDELTQQTLLLYSVDETVAWLGDIEVWIGRRLDRGRPWPEPPARPADGSNRPVSG